MSPVTSSAGTVKPLEVSSRDLGAHADDLQKGFAKLFGWRGGKHVNLGNLAIEFRSLGDTKKWSIVERPGRDGLVHACELLHGDEDEWNLWVTFQQRWTAVGKQGRVAFHSLNLGFYIGTPSPGTDTAIRLEWVGPTAPPLTVKGTGDSEADPVFDGEFAAHPHWQFDTSSGATFAGTPTNDSSSAQPPKDFGAQESALSFEVAAQEEMQRQMVETNMWLQKVHFPALAGWAATPVWKPNESIPPHQCVPGSLKELEQWSLSATEYVRYEFGKLLR